MIGAMALSTADLRHSKSKASPDSTRQILPRHQQKSVFDTGGFRLDS
jgi:hypothetical protein